MKKKVFIAVAVITYGIVCAFIGWLAGIDNGFDTGYKLAYLEMDKLLRQGARDKVSFSIEGLDIKFKPRGDSKTVKIRTEEKSR